MRNHRDCNRLILDWCVCWLLDWEAEMNKDIETLRKAVNHLAASMFTLELSTKVCAIADRMSKAEPVKAVAHLNIVDGQLMGSHRVNNEPVPTGNYSIYPSELTLFTLPPAQQSKVEPVYLFRRKGLDDFVTCTKERHDELSTKPLFEVKKLFPHPPADARDAELIELLKRVRPYVEDAYECAFPNEQENREMLEDIDAAIAAKEGK